MTSARIRALNGFRSYPIESAVSAVTVVTDPSSEDMAAFDNPTFEFDDLFCETRFEVDIVSRGMFGRTRVKTIEVGEMTFVMVQAFINNRAYEQSERERKATSLLTEQDD